MKREIKFRGVADTKDGGIELVYGDLSTNCNHSCAYRETHPDRIHWKRETGGFSNKPIRKGTAMQYTGLKDKNGVEIYEGDIIQEVLEIAGHQFNPIKYEVVFGEYNIGDDGGSIPLYFSTQGFALRFINDDGYKGLNQKDTLEVIGNIYENPELLDNNK